MRKKKVRSWRSTGEEVTLRTEVVLGWLRVRPWLDEVEEGGVLIEPLLLLGLKKRGSVRVGHRVQVNKLWLCDGSGQHNLPPHHKPCICLCVWKQWTPNESAAGCTRPSTLGSVLETQYWFSLLISDWLPLLSNAFINYGPNHCFIICLYCVIKGFMPHQHRQVTAAPALHYTSVVNRLSAVEAARQF